MGSTRKSNQKSIEFTQNVRNEICVLCTSNTEYVTFYYIEFACWYIPARSNASCPAAECYIIRSNTKYIIATYFIISGLFQNYVNQGWVGSTHTKITLTCLRVGRPYKIPLDKKLVASCYQKWNEFCLSFGQPNNYYFKSICKLIWHWALMFLISLIIN